MSIERDFYCDGPDCEIHARSIAVHPPAGFLTVREDGDLEHHFCGWDCLMKFAATKPLPEIIPA